MGRVVSRKRDVVLRVSHPDIPTVDGEVFLPKNAVLARVGAVLAMHPPVISQRSKCTLLLATLNGCVGYERRVYLIRSRVQDAKSTWCKVHRGR